MSSLTKQPCWQRWRLYINSATRTSTNHSHLAIPTAKCPIFQEERPALCLWYGTVPWWPAADYTASIMEVEILCTHWNRHLTLDIHLHSLHIRLFPKLPTLDLKNSSSTILVFDTALLLIKEITLKQMKCSNKPILMEFIGLLCSPSFWGSWFNKMITWSFETSATAPNR